VELANMTGNTQQAQMSMVSLRARFGVAPRAIIRDDNQPPATLPKSEIR
jgi:hypothetical protein